MINPYLWVFHGGTPNKPTLTIMVTIYFVAMVYLPLFGDPTNHHPAAVAANPLRRRWSSSRSAPPGRRRRRPGDSHRGAAPPRPRPRPWRPRRLPREGTPPFRLSPKGSGEKRRKAWSEKIYVINIGMNMDLYGLIWTNWIWTLVQ